MHLFEELIEDRKENEKIVKTFQSNDILCLKIFDKKNDKYSLKEDIKDRLLEISDEFIDSLGVDIFIHDIVLTGSLANFNWSHYSDLDLHIIIDYDDIGNSTISKLFKDIVKEFFDAKKVVWNEKHNITIKGFDVEVYVQDINEPHISSGVYSVLNDEWVVEPEKTSSNIDDRKILEKGDEFGEKIDSLISSEPDEETLKKVESLRKKLKKFRQCGLNTVGEYSYENLTFKLLRRNGYIKKLIDFKNKLIDKKLSVAQQ